ncbi:MAG: 50S ribosomal protein L15 [Endomicrobia bacterium]|nr:50S ribosomal protein L15 [Endomicrobiia bacterium]MCX7941408.1 50S ribosomal protein L15 [Endomicrobiia bacterium]MDW8055488.1 50S ribosomal protein L15 [Elusimicrobiota bacterium]
MNLSNLKPAPGSRHKPKRLGCGEGSGHGGSGSTRGMKGQRSRSGEGKNPGFEGGQMPLLRRIPKYGFSNLKFANVYQEVCLEDIISKIPKDVNEIKPELLKEYKLIKSLKEPIKVLLRKKGSELKLDRKLKLYVHKCSKSVRELIEKFGGEYVQLNS